MKKLRYDRYLTFEVEKALIRSHPSAEYIRVNWDDKGLIADVEENGKQIDVSTEMVEFVNRKLIRQVT